MYTYTHPRPRLIPIAFFFTARLSRDQTSLTFVISQESEERWLSFLFISTRDPGGSLQLHSTAQCSLEGLEPNSVLSCLLAVPPHCSGSIALGVEGKETATLYI